MSTSVDLAALAETIGGYGTAYVLTTTDARVRAVAVDPVLVDGVFRLTWSKRTAANIAANPVVTLLFPPLEPHGYSLIVDGSAEDTGDALHVSPTAAVLHRPMAHADGGAADEDCADDCRRI
ncbi:pyridoxamine 5'-phosphate oxidase [Flexivirga sp.]|uniref:pyridoxamine 5'-phosphate oxidase n=1 Tax=Flexivirga sp. TaxID=1962927 RepID=UPI003F806C3B